MFYVAYACGFLSIRNTEKGKNKTVPVVDVREATPFPTFDAADTEAKGRLDGHYAVLNIGWRPDPVSMTVHHFDKWQSVKIVRGPYDRPMPDHIHQFIDLICTVVAVHLSGDNEWIYTVELPNGSEVQATAQNLALAKRNDELDEFEFAFLMRYCGSDSLLGKL